MKEFSMFYAVGFQEPTGFIYKVNENKIIARKECILDKSITSKLEELTSTFEWGTVMIRQTSHGPFAMPFPKLTINNIEYEIKKIEEDDQQFYVKNAKETDILQLRQFFESICK